MNGQDHSKEQSRSYTTCQYFTLLSSHYLNLLKENCLTKFTVLIPLIWIAASATSSQTIPWRQASGTAGNGIAAVDVFRGNPDTLYAIGDRSFLRSTDRGEHFDSVYRITTDIGALRIDSRDSRLIYLSCIGLDPQSNDIWKSTTGGSSWMHLFIGRVFPTAVVEIDPVDPNTVYVGVGPNTIKRSTDRGETWNDLSPTGGAYLTSLAIATTNNSILYAGFQTGIWKSSDRGNKWSQLSLGFQLRSTVRLSVDARNENIVYVAIATDGTFPGGMYNSTNGGLFWQEINNGLGTDSRRTWSLLCNPRNPDQLFLGIVTVDSSTPSLYRSTNGGLNWLPFSNGLPPGCIPNSIVIDTLYDRMYVGVFAYRSSDDGLYIYDGGTMSVGSFLSQIRQSTLFENFPNPFNSETNIRFEIARLQRVSLKVFDLRGCEVATLVDRELMPGSYTVVLQMNAMASGAYFCVLQSDDAIHSKKIMILK